MKKDKSYYLKALFFLIIFLPLLFSLKDIFKESIPFWYDPARDFLLAQKNLQKIRLIGQETGIPGVFYGPYWIWLISLTQLLSKDPKVIALFIQTIPYFTIFPFILFQLTKKYGKLPFITLWLLFILNFKNYTTFLWNPHLAPLLFLILIFLISELEFPLSNKKKIFPFILMGIILGIIINLHMSFGTGIILSTFMLLILMAVRNTIKNKKNFTDTIKKSIISISLIVSGLLVTALPFFAFELRHGFQQIKAIQTTIHKTVIHSSDVVGQSGIKPKDIPITFFQKFSQLLNLPDQYSKPIFILSIILLLISLFKRKEKFSEKCLNLLLYISLSSFCILSFYLSSTNPVWSYHFIAVEIIFLIFLMIVITRSKIAKLILTSWALIFLFNSTKTFLQTLDDDPLQIQSLASKKSIVNLIYQNSENLPFTVFAYSPSIYTYDFDYLFAWYSQKNKTSPPLNEIKEQTPIYLIIPETDKVAELDFINYKTPNVEFETISKWQTPDKTLILKRQKI